MSQIYPKDRTHIIDRDSPIPTYHQIASDIIDRIAVGEWKIGDRLPSEAILHREYNVSAVTLRQALKYLENEKLIEKQQGKGTFLRDTPKPFVEDLSLPGTKRKAPGYVNSIQILEWGKDAVPSLYVKQIFQICQTEPMIFLRRLFLRQEKLLGLNDVWFPQRFVPGIMEEGLVEDSITKTLEERYGHRIVNVDNYIESARLNATEAALLHAPYDASVLRIYSAHQREDGQIVEYACTSWIGSLTRFHINVEV